MESSIVISKNTIEIDISGLSSGVDVYTIEKKTKLNGIPVYSCVKGTEKDKFEISYHKDSNYIVVTNLGIGGKPIGPVFFVKM